MTINACDFDIIDFSIKHSDIYTSVSEDFEELGGSELESNIRNTLQYTHPFTPAFIARVGKIVPFLPMADDDPDNHPLILGEMMTVAKLLIERQQEKYSESKIAGIRQYVSPKTKHRMTKIIAKEAIPAAGVGSIQKAVKAKMGDRMMDAMLLENKGGIKEKGLTGQYFAKEEEMKTNFRVDNLTAGATADADEVEDMDMYG
jgi:ATP-dependent Clp protease ATP-binding subunit ClpA